MCIRDRIPGDELAEMRTLGQIDEYLKNKTVISEDFEKERVSEGILVNQSSSETHADIGSEFFSIVSEKTGYPKEMLEMNMDLEADLGIDSINRVDIIWSLQEKLPHIPQAKGSEIGELRTLKEIVEHLDSLSPSKGESSKIPSKSSENSDSLKKKILIQILNYNQNIR